MLVFIAEANEAVSPARDRLLLHHGVPEIPIVLPGANVLKLVIFGSVAMEQDHYLEQQVPIPALR